MSAHEASATANSSPARRTPPSVAAQHLMKRLCVFCGSSPGSRPEYLDMARKLGCALAARQIGLVYGGGKLGMMGEIAKTVVQRGGEVIGVIPDALFKKEVAFNELSDLRVVSSMHERKALMADLADGFIALPGGLGTVEEFFEALTWAQLGIHRKPCGLLNVCGYYDDLLRFVSRAAEEKFIRAQDAAFVLTDDHPDGLLDQFARYQPPHTDKAAWALQMSQT